MQEGNHTVGETPRHHLPLGNATVGGAGPRSSNSTVKAVFIDALDTVTNASAPLQEPRQEPATCPTLVVPEDYTPNGEGPRTGQPESHLVRSPRSLEKPQKERVLILAANSGGSCSLRLGDYYNFLSCAFGTRKRRQRSSQNMEQSRLDAEGKLCICCPALCTVFVNSFACSHAHAQSQADGLWFLCQSSANIASAY